MYKLFLCLKYLRRRYLAIIAATAVALCVWMVLIVISVMDGFLAKAEAAARGLVGDIIVEPVTAGGIARYDEFIARLTGELRVSGAFELDAGAAGNGGQVRVTGRADATPAQLEGLIGRLDVSEPVTFPARAGLRRHGRHLADLRGELRLTADGKLVFSGAGKPASGGPPAGTAGLRLGPIYARVGEGLPEIRAATPVIYSYGLLQAGRGYSTTVQICGIRLPERLTVTEFADGLFVQAGNPHADFDPPAERAVRRTAAHAAEILDMLLEVKADLAERRSEDSHGAPQLRPDREQDKEIRKLEERQERLERALGNLSLPISVLVRLQADLAEEKAKPPARRNEAEVRLLTERLEQHRQEVVAHFAEGLRPPSQRVILGLGIGGLSFRAPDGTHVRAITPGTEVVLTLLPLGRGRIGTDTTPNTRTFDVIDDAKTDVHSIDSRTVYVPFATLQTLADMGERRDIDDPHRVDPARCSQIQIKVDPAFTGDRRLRDVREAVQLAWLDFCDDEDRRTEFTANTISRHVRVQTWYERLEDFVGPIQKQRTVVGLMFGIISLTAVLLIFAIFYMIVMQKVRDIGVIRAVGGSAAGVAQVFLAFGAITGLLGSAVGVLLGTVFVWNINGIHDWLAERGFQVWSPETYLFDKIPNEVDPAVCVLIVVWAVASGVIGALIPAVRAAVMEPAEAVRYE